MRGKQTTWDDPVLTVIILSGSLPPWVFISPHCWCDFLFQLLVGVATGLAHARSAQTQAKSSAEHRESNRHRFVLSPSGSQTMADNINCFPRLRQLSAPRQRNTLKLNTAQFSLLFKQWSFLCFIMYQGIWGLSGNTAVCYCCPLMI